MYCKSVPKACQAFNAEITQGLPEILVYFLFMYTISTWEGLKSCKVQVNSNRSRVELNMT